MAILPILCYPDQRLHTVARPVEAVDDRIRSLVSDMLATMYDARTLHSREVISRLVEAFGDKVFETVIKRSIITTGRSMLIAAPCSV